MTTDRELLELAAKAAGYTEFVYCEFWRCLAKWTDEDGGSFDSRTCWNPLTDDGDALRLAVCLHLDINQFPVTNGYVGMVEIWCNGDGDPAHVEYVRSEDDRLAATRRAIVCVAAEIGRLTK